MSALLDIRGLRVAYGGIHAVRGVDMTVAEGELVALIGANGAGKTSTMRAIAGQVGATGEIAYGGQPLAGVSSHARVAGGLVMVPEGRGIFTRMSILENLQIGAYLRTDRAGVADDIERMFALFPRLRERARQLAGTLSGGEQQMLAMARALMTRPRLLLLDEPSMGLSPLMVGKIFEVVRDISAQGMTILLVEQNAQLALAAAHRAYVMESGEIVASGQASALLADAKVRAAYLGEA